MDLDGDGTLDMISGSYPGELYVFRGLADGTFGEGTTIPGPRGEPLNVGRAAAPFAADPDEDGDLDLLVGDIRGHVWWVPNQAGGKALTFGEPQKLAVDGRPIQVGGGDAGPVLADWDGDERLDLIVGCGDGSVRLYEIAFEDGGVAVGAHRQLMPPSAGGMSRKHGETARCGARVKPCVVDFNADGRLDLLVGDVVVEQQPTPKPEATAALDRERQQAKLDWIRERYMPLVNEVQKRALATMDIEVGPAGFNEAWKGLTAEQRQAFGLRFREELEKDVQASALQRLLNEASRKVMRFRPPTVVRGHVWVLLRR